MQMLEPVHEAVGDAGPAGPGVDGGALLAGPHVAHPALVPQVAHLRVVTSGRPVLQHIHITIVGTNNNGKLLLIHVLDNPMSGVCMEGAGLVGGPRHSWRRCPARPDGDIRPEAILSTSFGTSRTASHRSVTLYKASESSDLNFWLDSTPF